MGGIQLPLSVTVQLLRTSDLSSGAAFSQEVSVMNNAKRYDSNAQGG